MTQKLMDRMDLRGGRAGGRLLWAVGNTRQLHRFTCPLPDGRRYPIKLVLGWLVAWALLTVPVSAAAKILDDFGYTTSSSARASWPNVAAPPVSMSGSGEWGAETVMLLTCDFATRSTRCIWDRNVSLDLSAHAEFALEVYTPNPAPISSLTLYFRSGSGWYGCSAVLQRAGWQTLHFAVGDFIPEGTPKGWNSIDGIRISPWKASSQNTYLAVRKLRASTPSVLLIRDPSSGNAEIVQQTIERHMAWLGGYGVSCGIITRAGVEAGLIREAKLVILPYNEHVSEPEMTNYESFVTSGGKLMVHYLLPGRLASLLGVRVTGWTAGDFGAWVFSDSIIPGLPARVLQASWNITGAVPSGAWNTRVTAWWEDSLGRNTGKAAWLSSDHGFFLSHVLLGDDADSKAYALLCLVGTAVPEVWPGAAAGAIAGIGNVGPYSNESEAVAAIRAQAANTLRSVAVEASLSQAASESSKALAAQSSGAYASAIFSAQAARAKLKEAYKLSLRPVKPEFRAIWEHHATGPYPGDWNSAMEALATNQLNAIFPNMLWGGLAHYPSSFLPRSAEYTQYGDQIAACIQAAHARGIQVHVWKVNWNLLGASQSFIDGLRAAQRTQVSSAGTPIDWLCPSHPDNFTLEKNAMLEVVTKYDVDGIHFDYIRYPDSDYCYCAGCRTRFQSQTGLSVTQWPAGVLAAGTLRSAFLDWRRSQITRLVDAVYKGTKALKPKVRVSAAVFPDAVGAYDGVGQDWRLWVTNGIVDFLCPMDYTTQLFGFTNLVAQQLAYVDGRIPIYPGIGAFVQDTDGTLAQVQATREARTGGFTLFELSPTSATTLLPALGAGATAPDEPDIDNDGLPDSWERKWFGALDVAGQNTDSDGDNLSDRTEYIIGTDPTTPGLGPTIQVLNRAGRFELEIQFEMRGATGPDPVPGYVNAERHYGLESLVAISSAGGWSPVAGFADLTATSPGQETRVLTLPLDAHARFYRLRVWLQEHR